jgi:LysM repeat protein
LGILFFPCLYLIEAPSVWAGGQAPGYEIDINELKKLKVPPTPKSSHAVIRRFSPRPSDLPKPAGENATYTIKQGDNLFKILMKDFGMSNREAELMIPEIMRANGLASGARLTVGQKIVIQQERRSPPPSRRKQTASSPAPKQPELQIESPLESPPTLKEEPAAAPAVVAAPMPEQSRPLVDMPLEVRSVTGADSYQLAEGVLNALAIPWTADKVVEGNSGSENGERFSIKVDRYLEFRSKKYVVTVSSQDPFAYTMLRLLEMGGYTIIRLNVKTDFTSLASQLLTNLEIPFTPGIHRFKSISGKGETRELNGVTTTLPHKRVRLFLTDTPLDAIAAEQLTTSSVETAIAPAP